MLGNQLSPWRRCDWPAYNTCGSGHEHRRSTFVFGAVEDTSANQYLIAVSLCPE
jgi:hypothetical protein